MNDQGQPFHRATPILLLVAILGGGTYFLTNQPFESSRTPSGESNEIRSSRLWEDPLRVVTDLEAQYNLDLRNEGEDFSLRNLYGQSHSTSRFQSRVLEQGTESLVLGVMLPTGNYHHSIETRRRIRYAVVSALSGIYLPANSERIEILRVDNRLFSPEKNSDPSPLSLLSYEVYQSYTEGKNWASQVAIIWLPEDVLGSKLYENYQRLLSDLTGNRREVRSVLLGPTNSNQLYSLVEEFGEQLRVTEAMEIYSPSDLKATINEAILEKVPLEMRPQVSDIAVRVNSYLDNGFSVEKQQEFVDKLAENPTYTLTRDMISTYLRDLDIDDSDLDWYDHVASSLPRDPEFETALNTLGVETREFALSIIGEADNYLDGGFVLDDQIEFLNAIGEQTQTPDRQTIVGLLRDLNIEDSDSTWFEYVAADWPDVPEATVSSALNVLDPQVKTATIRLIDSADDYLDNGFPLDKQLELIDYIVDNSITEFSRQVVTESLRTLDIYDSDNYWFEFIGADYPDTQEETISAALAELNSTLRLEVIALIDSTDSYLGTGLSLEKRVELIDRIVEDSIDGLNRQNVSNILRDLSISNSDQTWYDHIASDWPDRNDELVPRVTLSPNNLIRPEVKRLIEQSNSDLDSELSDDKGLELIQAVADSNLEGSNRDVASAFPHELSIEDRDSDWYEPISRDHPGPLSPVVQVALEQFQGDIRPDVQWLIEETVQYLDNGLSDIKQLELIGYLTQDKVLSLNRHSVAEYLKWLNIEDSNPVWYDTLGSDWPEMPLFAPERITIMSPRATIPSYFLAEALPAGSRSNENLLFESNPAANPYNVYRSITTDEKLMQVIFDELVGRGIDPRENGDKIALIYESDGRYGRVLEKLLNCKGLYGEANENNRKCFPANNISSFGYLRGLDGILPDDEGSGLDRNDDPQSNQNSILPTVVNLERPIGNQQFDYLRRVSDEISRGDYRAIGVLGTDTYDKLLILQALRNKNPNAVFFTTDLEASFSHADENKWSRNLLVATSMPLALKYGDGGSSNSCGKVGGYKDQNLPTGISAPPFRDNYQASYYYTTCLALPTEIGDAQFQSSLEQLNGRVHLFEIGRTQAVDLNAAQSQRKIFSRSGLAERRLVLGWVFVLMPYLILIVLAFFSWKKEDPKIYSNLRIAGTTVILLLIYCVMLYFEFRVSNISVEKQQFSALQFVAAVMVVVLSFIMSVFVWRVLNPYKPEDHNPLRSASVFCFFLGVYALGITLTLILIEAWYPGGEPLLITEGVSHWPTTVFRMQAIVFSFAFVAYSLARWRRNNREIEHSIFPGGITNKTKPQKLNGPFISNWINRIDNDNKDGPQKLDIKVIWLTYRYLGSRKLRLVRVLMKASAFIFLSIYVYNRATPDPALIRDSHPIIDLLFADFFVYLMIAISLVTISIANDVTSLTRAFIRALVKYDVRWKNPSDPTLKCKHLDSHASIMKPLSVMEVIANRTQAITPIVWFPFIILFLMILSRASLFEGWKWSLELILVYILISTYVLYAAIQLQREATRARDQAITLFENLELKEFNSARKESEKEHYEMSRKAALAHVNGLQRGAFVPWFQHPLFQALILPFTGSTGLLLLQFLG